MLLDLDVVYGSLLGGVGGHGHGHGHHHHPHSQNMSEHNHEHVHMQDHEHMNREHMDHDHEHMNHDQMSHEHMNHEHMKHEHRDREHMNNHEHMIHDEHSMMNEVEPDELEPVTERIKIIRKPPKPKRKGKNGKGKGKKGNRNRNGRRFGRNNLNSVVPPFNFRIPKTNFTCKGRAPGYYADMEAHCKVSINIIPVFSDFYFVCSNVLSLQKASSNNSKNHFNVFLTF